MDLESEERRNTCKNCQTERLSIIARELCKRCYRISRKMEQIKRWNPSDESTLLGCPKSLHILPPDKIALMQADVLEQLRDLLKKRRLQEDRLKGPISSMDLECQLKWLAEKAGVRDARRIMHGTAVCFDSLIPHQRSTLFGLLSDIEENVPQRQQIHWTRYMNPTRRSVPE